MGDFYPTNKGISVFGFKESHHLVRQATIGWDLLEAECFIKSHPLGVDKFDPSQFVKPLIHEYGMQPVLDNTGKSKKKRAKPGFGRKKQKRPATLAQKLKHSKSCKNRWKMIRSARNEKVMLSDMI